MAQGNVQTAVSAQQSAMPNLSLFALPAAAIQQQLPMQQSPMQQSPMPQLQQQQQQQQHQQHQQQQAQLQQQHYGMMVPPGLGPSPMGQLTASGGIWSDSQGLQFKGSLTEGSLAGQQQQQ